ncbi:MAG: TspO/MBR family protein [Hyphomicrobium sp.]
MPDTDFTSPQASWSALAIIVLLVVATAMTGSIFKPGPWYETLNKPTWTPPNWVFPVAWTIFYAMIALAGWLVWRRAGWSTAMTIWGVGLVVNAAWSYLMFGMQRIDLALIDVAALWVAIAAFAWAAAPIDLRASLLFLPYLGWATFAGLLNFAVWRMN